MSLLIFLPAAPGTLQKELNELLEPSLRRNVASKVNEAILTSMGAHGESRMRNLVRLRPTVMVRLSTLWCSRDVPTMRARCLLKHSSGFYLCCNDLDGTNT
jgi:hypothetical protein